MKLNVYQQEVLDKIVCDVAMEQASNVNNGGCSEQVEWLILNGWTEKEIKERLTNKLLMVA